MAISVSTDIAAALSQTFAKKIARQYNRVTMLGAALPSEGAMIGNAKNVAWDVVAGIGPDGAGQTANAYNEATAVSDSEETTDPIVPAILPWGLYRAAFSVSDQEFDTANVSKAMADAASFKLFEERFLSACSKLASIENVDFWSGTGAATTGVYVGAPNIIGLFGGALSASGTYAQLAVSDYPEWASNVLANGGVPRPLTFDLLAQLESEIFNASSEKPDLIVCSTGVWRKYSLLFEPLRRFNDQVNKVYATSVDALEWRGIPVIRDKDAPEAAGSGTLTMLNTKHISKVYLPSSDNSVQDVFKVRDEMGQGFNGDMEFTDMSVPFRLIPLARVGDYSNFMVKSTMQLKVTRRNAMGTIADISVT